MKPKQRKELFSAPSSEAQASLIFESLDLKGIPTPAHITDEVSLEKNLEILYKVHENTGAQILIALKAFAQFSLFPLIGRYLQGATASSLFEARLAYEELAKKEAGKEVHACAPAYPPEDFEELQSYSDHVVFNSFSQLEFFKEKLGKEKNKNISIGIRVNPEHSEVKTSLYDPCASNSRLGVRRADFIQNEDAVKEIEGLHFHSLCELGSDALERTWQAFEEKFGYLLAHLQWVNLGGGHHITRSNYDLELLYALINKIRTRYKKLTIYLEPGEAVALNSGVLAASVLDIIPGNRDGRRQKSYPSAILDTSATAHMPDVLEMPYQPEVFSHGSWAVKPGTNTKYNYHLGGLTCLAGDVIGDYAFAEPLYIGQKLFFRDMSHYTMVKNSNFNGIRPPAIAIGNTQNKKVRLVKQFLYEDYKNRLS